MIRARPLAPMLALSAFALAPLAGCVTARTLSESDRHSLTHAWDGRLVYLRSSVNVLPFFADGSKRLVSTLHADALAPYTDAQGTPVAPGPVEMVIPLGTRVRVERLEFPTGLVVTRRPLQSPRECPWVYLSFPHLPRDRPYIVVLRPSMTTREDALAALGDLFTDDEPSLWLKDLGPATKRAILEKRLLLGMDGEQVLRSWGRPESIRQDLALAPCPAGDEGCARSPARVETWTWPRGARTATFREGKLAAATPALEQAR